MSAAVGKRTCRNNILTLPFELNIILMTVIFVLLLFCRNISKPRFMSTLVDVANCTLGEYVNLTCFIYLR